MKQASGCGEGVPEGDKSESELCHMLPIRNWAALGARGCRTSGQKGLLLPSRIADKNLRAQIPVCLLAKHLY